MSAIIRSRKKRSRKAGPPVHDDLIGRDFTAERLRQKWLWDITERRAGEGN